MIHLANEDGFGEVVIGPELPYAIFKISNGNTTARKGVWSWSAQEVYYRKFNPHPRAAVAVNSINAFKAPGGI